MEELKKKASLAQPLARKKAKGRESFYRLQSVISKKPELSDVKREESQN